MLQILAHAQRPSRMTAPPPEKKKRDRASTSAREYFEAVAVLDELRVKRKECWPNDLSEDDMMRWRNAMRRKNIAKIDLSYWNPQTDAGALAALKVVRDELDRIEPLLKTCDAEQLPRILEKAEKALRRSARSR